MVRFYSLLLALLLWQCNAPAGQSRITGPAYAGNPIYTGGERFALTEATIGLGAQLFNDPQLSIDSTISCASCHKADAYFSDPGKVKSEGINGHPTERNTSALNNLAWHPYFFAEGGVRTLELSTFVPINNRHEFGRELHQVVEEGRFGQLTYLRVYQGTITKGMTIVNTRTGKKLKVPRLVRMHSDEMEDVQKSESGEIVALFGVDCQSGDTFTDGTINYAMTSMRVPDPVMSYAVAPKSRTESSNFSAS